MAIRHDNIVEGEFYHLYNRGNAKSDIFLDDNDYDRFIKLLYVCNSQTSFSFRESIVKQHIDALDFERGKPLVEICAWVLMPNHFHLLVISHRSDLWLEGVNPISEFMRKVSTAYAMYFNKKYGRTGALFEGKFKSKLVAENNYFNYIFSYIHLNPIKLIQPKWKESGLQKNKKLFTFINNYKYSSLMDYFGSSRKQARLLEFKSVPEHIKESGFDDIIDWFNTFTKKP